jgi:hypothetical protein
MTSYKKTMRQALEEMYPIVEEVGLDEAKYELYHKDFSSAMQHAYHVAKKHHGITIDPKEIDDKVATGPSKPSEGKTNKYRLKGDKGAVQIQVYNKGGSKPFELNMYKEEVELHEKEITLFKSMQPTAYDRMRRRMNPKDIKTVDASDEKQIKDLESRGWIRNPWDEEVDLDEGGMKDLLIKAQELMGPSKNRKEGIQMVAKGLKVSEKEATKLVDAVIKMNEELAKIKGKTPGDEGRRSAVEDDIERAEKKGDKKEVEKLKEADLEEGKMSQLHQYIKDKKSAEEIAKLMKVDVKTIKALMSSYESTDGDNMEQNSEYMEMLAAACGGTGGGGSMVGAGYVPDKDKIDEGAAADARRAMKKDKDFSRRDRADDDDNATDDDVKAASKNIMMQLRKSISLKGRFDVEFADGKKVKIPVKMAQLATKKYSAKKPADKEKFQAKIGKSYRDMLSALKEELQPQKESILERMNRKIKENKNG